MKCFIEDAVVEGVPEEVSLTWVPNGKLIQVQSSMPVVRVLGRMRHECAELEAT